MNNLERYYSQILRPYGDLSKPTKIIDEKHLDFIRSLPCVVSGYHNGTDKSCVAHHVQKKSQIRNDLLTIPLRADIHTNFHNNEVNFENEQNVDFRDALIAKLVETIVTLQQNGGTYG